MTTHPPVSRTVDGLIPTLEYPNTPVRLTSESGPLNQPPHPTYQLIVTARRVEQITFLRDVIEAAAAFARLGGFNAAVSCTTFGLFVITILSGRMTAERIARLIADNYHDGASPPRIKIVCVSSQIR